MFGTECQDQLHPPPTAVFAPVHNSAFWFHHPQAFIFNKSVWRIVGLELVLLCMLHPSTLSSDEETYCYLCIVDTIFIQKDTLLSYFHLPKYIILRTLSGFICVRLAYCIMGLKIPSFETRPCFCQLLSFQMPIDGGQL